MTFPLYSYRENIPPDPCTRCQEILAGCRPLFHKIEKAQERVLEAKRELRREEKRLNDLFIECHIACLLDIVKEAKSIVSQ